MGKKQRRQVVVKSLTENIENLIVWQKRPNTAVRVTTHFEKVRYTELGFTKVNYPDEWDAVYGVGLAVRKAIADISRQIVNGLQV